MVFEEGLGRVIVDFYINCFECLMIYSLDEFWKCKLYFLVCLFGRFFLNFIFKSYRFRFLMLKIFKLLVDFKCLEKILKMMIY